MRVGGADQGRGVMAGQVGRRPALPDPVYRWRLSAEAHAGLQEQRFLSGCHFTRPIPTHTARAEVAPLRNGYIGLFESEPTCLQVTALILPSLFSEMLR